MGENQRLEHQYIFKWIAYCSFGSIQRTFFSAESDFTIWIFIGATNVDFSPIITCAKHRPAYTFPYWNKNNIRYHLNALFPCVSFICLVFLCRWYLHTYFPIRKRFSGVFLTSAWNLNMFSIYWSNVNFMFVCFYNIFLYTVEDWKTNFQQNEKYLNSSDHIWLFSLMCNNKKRDFYKLYKFVIRNIYCQYISILSLLR